MEGRIFRRNGVMIEKSKKEGRWECGGRLVAAQLNGQV